MIEIKRPTKKRGVCFRLQPALIEAIDKIATKEKVDRTVIMETALEAFLELYKGPKAKKM
jgi:predicted transcriptional regulator